MRSRRAPRTLFVYISDDGDVLALRMGDWKVVLMEQRAKTTGVLGRTFRSTAGRRRCSTCAEIPFERADENSNTYWDWVISHVFVMYEMQGVVAQPDR